MTISLFFKNVIVQARKCIDCYIAYCYNTDNNNDRGVILKWRNHINLNWGNLSLSKRSTIYFMPVLTLTQN